MRLSLLLSLFLLHSCALVTVPVKIVGKATTTTIGLVGKVAGAGIDAMVDDDDDNDEEEEKPEKKDE